VTCRTTLPVSISVFQHNITPSSNQADIHSANVAATIIRFLLTAFSGAAQETQVPQKRISAGNWSRYFTKQISLQLRN